MLYLKSDTELWFGRYEGEDIYSVLVVDFDYLLYCCHYLPNFVIDSEEVDELEFVLPDVKIKMLRDKKQVLSEEELLTRLGITDWKNEFGEHDYIPDEVYEKLNDNNIESNNDFFFDDDHKSYSKYNGYNGWDDDTIDSAFEGDPMNTWNVD